MTMQDNFVTNVLVAMQKADCNRSQLAEKMGVSKSYVTQLLNKQMNPSLRVVENVADALGVQAHHLLKPAKKVATSA